MSYGLYYTGQGEHGVFLLYNLCTTGVKKVFPSSPLHLLSTVGGCTLGSRGKLGLEAQSGSNPELQPSRRRRHLPNQTNPIVHTAGLV